MDYKEINKTHKNRMKSIFDSNYEMEWEDPEFMDRLLGKLPSIRNTRNEGEKASEEIAKLKKLLLEYDSFLTNKKDFFGKISKCINTIKELDDRWFDPAVYEIKDYLDMHEFCLISGEGGIGKSYFISCFERELSKKGIPHLCIYGKFLKNTNDIDVDQIIKDSGEGFLFAFDAINEIPEREQKNLLMILERLVQVPSIRIVVTYRNNSMDKSIQYEYKKLATHEYRFPGVSFESVLSKLVKLSVPDVYMYQDILFSNNALMLKALDIVLSSEKVANETVPGVVSVTHILEDSIKRPSKKIWDETKEVANWMYVNEEKSINISILKSIIQNEREYIEVMIQKGIGEVYEHNSELFFHFVIDSLSDYLIARSLLKDIEGKDYEERVDVVKTKIEKLYGIEEAAIITIFDKYKSDYSGAYKLLSDTGLLDFLTFETLVKIHYEKDGIKLFQTIYQTIFNPTDYGECLSTIGGYADKPFNCSNYLFSYYCDSPQKASELSNYLSGHYLQRPIKNRLKNLLYYIAFNEKKDRRDDEAFYFSVLCCAAPNKEVRFLASKLLYDLVGKNSEYKEKLIETYSVVYDHYIKESIIHVLTSLKSEDTDITSFLHNLIQKENDLTAKSIKRISSYLNDPCGYIKWDRTNLYYYNPNATISDSLNSILMKVGLMDKDFIPFRYWGRDYIEFFTFFLETSKNEIEKVNEYLKKEYSCVEGGECSGWRTFEERVMTEINTIAEIRELDRMSFMESFGRVLEEVFDYYEEHITKERSHIRELDFFNSTYIKCVDIARGLYFGSLMCNYFSNEFATYNNDQNTIGYEPYEYDDQDGIMLTSPVPRYQDMVEQIGDIIISSIYDPEAKHDIAWVGNADITRENLLRILSPIEYKGEKWVLLAGRISMYEKTPNEWRDSYDVWCCTSDEVTIHNDGKERYLTIELEDYKGPLKDYPFNDNKSWFCKEVKSINNKSDELDQTILVLPPSDILKSLSLSLNVSDLSWETCDKLKVIICNNNKHSYYLDQINSTIFIRKDCLDKYIEGNHLKYFAYAERYIPEIGYDEKTSLHFEIYNGKIVKEIPNCGGFQTSTIKASPQCERCKHKNIIKNSHAKTDLEQLKEMLASYGAYKEND